MVHQQANDHHVLASILAAIIYPIVILLLAYGYVWLLFNLARWLGSLA